MVGELFLAALAFGVAGARTGEDAAGLLHSESVDLREDEVERESGDEFRPNTLCGFCFILARYELALLSARLVLLVLSVVVRGGSPVARVFEDKFGALTGIGTCLSVEVSRLRLRLRSPRPRRLSGMTGGEGSLDFEIHERLAKSANDSVVFALSCGVSTAVSWADTATLFLANRFGPSSRVVGTLGVDFEPASHGAGGSIIDLLLVRVCCLSTSETADSAANLDLRAVSRSTETGLGGAGGSIGGDTTGGGRHSGSSSILVLRLLRDFSMSRERSKDGVLENSKAGISKSGNGALACSCTCRTTCWTGSFGRALSVLTGVALRQTDRVGAASAGAGINWGVDCD